VQLVKVHPEILTSVVAEPFRWRLKQPPSPVEHENGPNEDALRVTAATSLHHTTGPADAAVARNCDNVIVSVPVDVEESSPCGELVVTPSVISVVIVADDDPASAIIAAVPKVYVTEHVSLFTVSAPLPSTVTREKLLV
jgi:hypothetical protein